MTSDDRFIGQLEVYLDRFDGETPLPDQVRAEIHAALPRTRQVSARPPGSWAAFLSGVSAGSRWGLAAAGLVLAIGIGTALVAGNRDHGVAGTQAPLTPPAIPSAIPSFPSSATSLRAAPIGPCVIVRAGFDCTAAGTYRLDPDVVPVPAAIDVPRGWLEWDVGPGTAGVLVDSGRDAPSGSGWGVLFSSFGRIRVDPCDPAAGFVGNDTINTAAEVVQVMQRWPGFQVSTPQPISMGGYSGLLVEVTSSRRIGECPTAMVWETGAGGAVDGYPMAGQLTSRPAQFRILEIGGYLLIIRTTDFPQESPFEDSSGVAQDPTRHAADQRALRTILDSLRFAPHP
jgi:hypothetical protein